MSEMFELVHGFLIDIDGVLYIDDRPIEGAIEVINTMRDDGFSLRFLTNTTRKTRKMLHDQLNELGFDIDLEEIISAPYAALRYLQQKEDATAYYLMNDVLRPDFEAVPPNDVDPDFVVVGDLGNGFTYDRLNTAFQCLMNGAELVAFQKNRFWKKDGGYHLDAGPFVALLEYAVQTTARVFGKPSPHFFRTALEELGCAPEPEKAVMIGDDIETDVRGAMAVSIGGILVRTGKYHPDIYEKSKVTPDLVIDSIADMLDLL